MSSRPSRGAARLAAILDALPDALLLVNCNGTVVNANTIALETFETQGDALVGRGLLDLLPSFDSRRIPGSMRLPDDDQGRTKPTRMIARRTDGSEFPVEVTSANLEDARTPYADPSSQHYTGDELLMLVVRDLSGTVDTEAELARQQRQTEMILRAAAEGVVGVDTDGKVVLVNPSAAQILGYRASDLGGQELHPLVHHSRPDGSPLPYAESPLADTMRSGRKHRVRGQVLWAKDGRAVPVDLTTAPVRDGDQLVGAVMTFTDRRKHDALAARHAQLLAVLDESLRGPLEQLRTELATLASDDAGQLWPEANQVLHYLTAGYTRMTTLIDNVLGYQRLDAGREKLALAKVELDAVVAAGVEGAVELIGPGRAQFAVHAPPIEAEVDPERLATALAHLIADVAGVDATGNAPAGGGSGDSTIVVAAAQRGKTARIEVRGPYSGGDPVHEPVVRGIVQRHGGVLQTHEVPGGGASAYVLEVPLTAKSSPSSSRPTKPATDADRDNATTVMPVPKARRRGTPSGNGPMADAGGRTPGGHTGLHGPAGPPRDGAGTGGARAAAATTDAQDRTAGGHTGVHGPAGPNPSAAEGGPTDRAGAGGRTGGTGAHSRAGGGHVGVHGTAGGGFAGGGAGAHARADGQTDADMTGADGRTAGGHAGVHGAAGPGFPGGRTAGDGAGVHGAAGHPGDAHPGSGHPDTEGGTAGGYEGAAPAQAPGGRRRARRAAADGSTGAVDVRSSGQAVPGQEASATGGANRAPHDAADGAPTGAADAYAATDGGMPGGPNAAAGANGPTGPAGLAGPGGQVGPGGSGGSGGGANSPNVPAPSGPAPDAHPHGLRALPALPAAQSHPAEARHGAPAEADPYASESGAPQGPHDPESTPAPRPTGRRRGRPSPAENQPVPPGGIPQPGTAEGPQAGGQPATGGRPTGRRARHGAIEQHQQAEPQAHGTLATASERPENGEEQGEFSSPKGAHAASANGVYVAGANGSGISVPHQGSGPEPHYAPTEPTGRRARHGARPADAHDAEGRADAAQATPGALPALPGTASTDVAVPEGRGGHGANGQAQPQGLAPVQPNAALPSQLRPAGHPSAGVNGAGPAPVPHQADAPAEPTGRRARRAPAHAPENPAGHAQSGQSSDAPALALPPAAGDAAPRGNGTAADGSYDDPASAPRRQAQAYGPNGADPGALPANGTPADGGATAASYDPQAAEPQPPYGPDGAETGHPRRGVTQPAGRRARRALAAGGERNAPPAEADRSAGDEANRPAGDERRPFALPPAAADRRPAPEADRPEWGPDSGRPDLAHQDVPAHLPAGADQAAAPGETAPATAAVPPQQPAEANPATQGTPQSGPTADPAGPPYPAPTGRRRARRASEGPQPSGPAHQVPQPTAGVPLPEATPPAGTALPGATLSQGTPLPGAMPDPEPRSGPGRQPQLRSQEREQAQDHQDQSRPSQGQDQDHPGQDQGQGHGQGQGQGEGGHPAYAQRPAQPLPAETRPKPQPPTPAPTSAQARPAAAAEPQSRAISVRTLGQGVPYGQPPAADQRTLGGGSTASGRRRKLAAPPQEGEQRTRPGSQEPTARPRHPQQPQPPRLLETHGGRAYAIGAPDEGAEGPEPLDGPNGAIDVTDSQAAPPKDDELPPEPLDNPRRLLVWPAPDASTQQALSDRGYRPVIVHSREEVDAQIAAFPAALFVDPLTGPITRTALQSLRTAAVAAEVPVLVTAGLGQATREAAYGADPAVLLKALAPRDGDQHPPRVLLIEAHDAIAGALSATLERRGMQVARAASDADAVALAAQMRPNLVVMDLTQVRRRRAGIVDWLRANGLLNRTPLVVYTSADIDPTELPRLASGETVLFLAERSTSTEVQTRIVDLLTKIGAN